MENKSPEDVTNNTTVAAMNSSIRRSDGYPVYIVDDIFVASRLTVQDNISVYQADKLIKDRQGLSDFFSPTKRAADTDSPVIFLIKNRTKGVDDLIKTVTSANIVTYYQDSNFKFKPIVTNDKADIKRQINEQYRQNFSTANSITDFVDVIKSRANTPPIPTGFRKLDDLLSGGLHEGLISVGANTSLGKTTFVLQIADHIAKSGQDVYIFSLEMSKYELISKSVSRITYEHCIHDNLPVNLAKSQLGITDGNRYQKYTDDEKRLIQAAISEYKQGIAQGLYIHESVADMTVEQIDGIIRTHYERTRQYPVVVIDYLQLLQHKDRYINSNDKLRTDVNITSLKRLSRQYKVPVIAISSFNRTSYGKDDVDLSSFKESGGIEYSSDVIIGLQQKAERADDDTNSKDRLIKLSVLKNRQGKKDESVELVYKPIFNYYEESDGDQKITYIR